MKKVIMIIVLVIFILLLIAYFVVGNYFYNIALNPKTDKGFVLDGITAEETEEFIKWREEQAKWLSDNSKDVNITSTNNGNLKLHAYEINNHPESNIWTIVIHGYMAKGSGMTGIARQFEQRNHNVLIVDLRGHGKSEGSYVGMGWHDRLDIIDWINYIIDKNDDNKTILYGISMGAATTMMTTGENLPSNVKLAISDCGYTSAWDEFSHQLKQLFNLPDFPVLYAANTVCKIRAGYSLKDSSSIEQVKKSKIPTLFIHGDQDDFVPFKMMDILYDSASCKKEKLIVEGAGHGLASSVDPQIYWDSIDSFIKKYIGETNG